MNSQKGACHKHNALYTTQASRYRYGANRGGVVINIGFESRRGELLN